jgi:hypothetical protein
MPFVSTNGACFWELPSSRSTKFSGSPNALLGDTSVFTGAGKGTNVFGWGERAGSAAGGEEAGEAGKKSNIEPLVHPSSGTAASFMLSPPGKGEGKGAAAWKATGGGKGAGAGTGAGGTTSTFPRPIVTFDRIHGAS